MKANKKVNKKADKKAEEKTKGIIEKNKKIMKWVHKVCPSYLPLMLLEEAIKAGRVLLNLIISANVIDGIVAGSLEKRLITLVLILVAINMLAALLQWAIDKVLIVKRRRVTDGITVAMAGKSATMDYQVLENSATQDMVKRIEEGENYSGGINGYCSNIANVFRYMITFIYTVFVLVPLFKVKVDDSLSFSFVNSIWANLIVIAAFIFIVFRMYRLTVKLNKVQNKYFEAGVQNNRRFSYFTSYITDYARGKGVRIFNMYPLIRKKSGEYEQNAKNLFEEQRKVFTGLNSRQQIAAAFCWLLSYGYVGLKAIGGAITIGELSLYAGVILNLYQYIVSGMSIVSWLTLISQYLCNYVEYLELPNEKYDGTIPVEKRLDNEYELEFRDVSFHYPNSKDMVLSHVNAKIHVGKKMAIVGKNGSGKSTFIKLLCRLYDPTEGEILLNGIDIRKYDYDEYRNLFGVVFQDFQLFSFSVAQNVAASVEYDEERVWKCLEQAGLKERVKEMEKGIETVIYKQDDEGVEISGGEAQKLAIARALYRNAPVVILDEPTAALDPMAELEVYEKFDEMVEDKTAIYISHRMSSCRFCKNILVFDEGQIVQMGSHESLVQESEGLYAKLWNAQAQYYI